MSDRYEVTGHSSLGLDTATNMPVSERLGREMARAYAPANGAVGKLNATISRGINWTLGGANNDNRHFAWDQLIQEPIDARLKVGGGPGGTRTGDIELLAPGEWTIDSYAWFEWSKYGGEGFIDLIVTVRSKTGDILRQQSSRNQIGEGDGTVQVHLADAMIEPADLPATVDIWFVSGKWRGVRGGAGFSGVSVKKTQRIATETQFIQDTGKTDVGNNG